MKNKKKITDDISIRKDKKEDLDKKLRIIEQKGYNIDQFLCRCSRKNIERYSGVL